MKQEEQISVFDMFKIGVGPSSSHTLGPWYAARQFTDSLKKKGLLDKVVTIRVKLYGSLAKTGLGHGTDIAVQLGLAGYDPVTFDVNAIGDTIKKIESEQQLTLAGVKPVEFVLIRDIVFLIKESLPYHPNALTFVVETEKERFEETYY